MCLKALRWALSYLSPAERMTGLYKLQNRTLETMGDGEAVVLRRYAAKTMELCIERVSPLQQVEVLTDSTRKALARIDRSYLSEACAAVINMSRLPERLVDPA